MPSYEISLKGVKAENAQQAEQVKESLIALVSILKPQDLIDLSKLLIEKPNAVEKAKEFKHLF